MLSLLVSRNGVRMMILSHVDSAGLISVVVIREGMWFMNRCFHAAGLDWKRGNVLIKPMECSRPL